VAVNPACQSGSNMMRALYSLLLYLLTPLVLLRLAWRGLRAPAYWRRWPERFAWLPVFAAVPRIWIHAVSVGETQAALPLVQALQARYPGHRILITTTTPTGSQRVRALFGDRVEHVYLPYDLPGAVRRFLDAVQPDIALVMETELWPNLFRACARHGIPLLVMNARLSERSCRGYGRFAALTRATLADVTHLAAQGERDAQRFIGLGAPAERVSVCGSIKFDLYLPASLREEAEVLRRAFGVERPVWIAASTHEGEDEQVLEAFRRMRAADAHPNALLVLVPRHPERFATVAELCRAEGHSLVQRSSGSPCTAVTDVYLGDTMGELPMLMAATDLVFMGGSLVRTGGHNMLEAAALGLPVVFGPHVFNFEEIAERLLEAGAARQVRDAGELAAVVADWLADANARHRTGERGRVFVEQNRGARERMLALIEPHLSA
jgi:3-deoxy-D-manno-octulosonic-acid transferase